MELSGYFSLLMAPVSLSLLSLVMHQAMKKGSLDRNSAIGLRTKATLTSDRAWHAGHAAAAPYFSAMAVIGLVVAVTSVALPFVIGAEAGRYPAGMIIAPALGLLIQVIVLLSATSAANSAARKS